MFPASLIVCSILFAVLAAQDYDRAKLVVQTGHEGGVTEILITPDERFLLTVGQDGVLIMWDIETKLQLRDFGKVTGRVQISTDGKMVAANSVVYESGVIWDLETGRIVRKFTADFESFVLTPDFKRVVGVRSIKPPKTVEDRPPVFPCPNISELKVDRLTANEFYAISSLQTLWNAQITFQITRDQTSFGTLEQLRDAGLIDATLATGVKSGYRIALIVKPASGQTPASIEATAVPIEYCVTGARSFYLATDGSVTGADHKGGPAGPADKKIGSDTPPHEYKLTVRDLSGGSTLWESQPLKTWSNIAISPDGRLLAFDGPKSIEVLDVLTGRLISTPDAFALLPTCAPYRCFSRDGKLLITGMQSWDPGKPGLQKTSFWDSTTGALVKSIEHPPGRVFISPDAKYVGVSYYGDSGSLFSTKIFSLGSGEEVASSEGELLDFLENGNPVVAVDPTARKPEVTRRPVKPAFELQTITHPNRSSAGVVALSSKGKYAALAIRSGGTFRVVDVKEGSSFELGSNDLFEAGMTDASANGRTLAVSQADGISLVDLTTGRPYFKLTDAGTPRLSPDGQFLFSYQTSSVHLWDLAAQKKVAGVSVADDRLDIPLSFAPTGRSVIFAKADDKDEQILLVSRDLMSGVEQQLGTATKSEVTRRFASKSLLNGRVRFLPDIHSQVTSEAGAADLAKSDPYFKPISPATREAIANGKASVHIIDDVTGAHLGSMYFVGESDWIITTPEGLFDASPAGRKKLHYVIGFESFTLDQMKDAYYVPGLLSKIVKGEPLPKIQLFSKKDLFPDVEFKESQPGSRDLVIKVTNRGGGIGAVQVLVNGKEFVRDARGANFDSQTKGPVTLNVSLKDAPLLEGAENKIEVIARNAAGSLTNRGTRGGAKVLKIGGAAAQAPPNIYAIVGGISDYTGDALKLNFAAKDAEDFARALEMGAVRLLGDTSKVHVRLLTSKADKSAVQFTIPDAKISTATKADFEQAFADFKGASPNDVFIVYLAGHGVSLNLNQNPAQVGGDTYLYLTQEATTTDRSVLTVDVSRKAMTISSEELKDLMKQNKALKQVLILDTCASGAAANSLVAKRDLPSDQIAALERLKDNTGFFVLMGSSADAVSYEASQFGQGLLTYSLLRAMDGERLRPGGYADINELFTFAKQTVPTLAKNIGGIQQPLSITPDVAGTFDIGRFTADEQTKIVLSNPKPLILRPNLQNEKLRFDNLKLTPLLRAELRNIGHAAIRGGESPIVFVEADEMHDAVMPSGGYVVEGEELTITVVLVRNNDQVGNEIKVTGKLSDKEQVIRKLLQEIVRALG